jgi:hypothetical protein
LQDESFVQLGQLCNGGKGVALSKDWSIVSAGNLDNERLVDSFGLKMLCETLAKE